MTIGKRIFWSKLDPDEFALGIWFYVKPWCICIYLGKRVLNIHGKKGY